MLGRFLELEAWAAGFYERSLPLLAPSETKFLAALAVLIGLLAGVITYLFDILIAAVFELGLGGAAAQPPGAPFLSRWRCLVFPALGGLIVGPLAARYCPEAKGHGISELMLAMARQGGRMRGKVAAWRAVLSAVTIGTGGSAGREGPVIQLGAAIGSWLGQTFRLPPITLKTMAASGSAAGIAAALNAPLGGMAFALEIILGEISAGPFAMVVLSAVVAATVSRGLHGSSAYFSVPHYRLVHSGELLLYVLLGISAGLLAKVFVYLLYRVEDEFEASRLNPAWRPAVGGLLAGAIGLFAPGALGAGYLVIEAALKGAFAPAALLALLAAKSVTTALSLGSGGSGGIFMPALFLGAMLGGLFGAGLQALFPGFAHPGAYAMVGMAAFVAGATHAPLTAILILFEMTYDYAIILPLMAAVVSAVLTARTIEPESIYTLKLARRGIKLREPAEESVLGKVEVGEIMTREVKTLPADFPIGRLGRHFNKTKHTGFPVVDADGKLAGMVTYAEASAAYGSDPPPPAELPIRSIMRVVLPPLYPDDKVGVVIRRMSQEGIDRLPVVSREEPGKLVGIVSRTDLLSLYSKRIPG